VQVSGGKREKTVCYPIQTDPISRKSEGKQKISQSLDGVEKFHLTLSEEDTMQQCTMEVKMKPKELQNSAIRECGGKYQSLGINLWALGIVKAVIDITNIYESQMGT